MQMYQSKVLLFQTNQCLGQVGFVEDWYQRSKSYLLTQIRLCHLKYDLKTSYYTGQLLTAKCPNAGLFALLPNPDVVLPPKRLLVSFVVVAAAAAVAVG
jgi:hypothetical protein